MVLLLASLVTCQVVVGNPEERFTLESCSVPVSKLGKKKQAVTAETMVFKLDSAEGSVWRLDKNFFVRVGIGNHQVNEDEKNLKNKNEEVLKRLRSIKIPAIEFHEEPFSNVVAFLQKQLMDFDPEVKGGSGDYIWLNACGVQGGDLTFSGREVSFLTCLNIITRLNGLSYLIVDNSVLLLHSCVGESFSENCYYASSFLRNRLGDTTISNAMVMLGLKLGRDSRLEYFPELNMIYAFVSDGERQTIEKILIPTDLARRWPGRYRLSTLVLGNTPNLLLIDDKTGETWIYNAIRKPDDSIQESFDAIRDVDLKMKL